MMARTISQERLLQALAEQLKLPLLQIARQAELAQAAPSPQVVTSITQIADMALRLVDSYLLSTSAEQIELQLEPVTLSSVLQDTAQRLDQVARHYQCEIEVHLAGKYEPVMAHRPSLEAAFTTLGYAFIEAQPTENGKSRLLLAAHRSAKGLVAGVFGDQPGLSSDMYRRARALYGIARQPLTHVSPAAGAGVFIADALLTPLSAPLRVAYHHKLAGLAATLLPSQQLQLIRA